MAQAQVTNIRFISCPIHVLNLLLRLLLSDERELHVRLVGWSADNTR